MILINYNSGEFLSTALASIGSQTLRPAEIIVLDNGSTDGSLGLVDWAAHPDVQLICLTQNIGYAAATNVAAAAARSEWLAMLNSDAAAAPDWLEALSTASARHPGRKIFASAQMSMDHPEKVDGAGDVYSVTGLAWRGGYRGLVTNLPQEGTCFGACAAGALISRQLFHDLGGFEETFFCYLEDLDFSYRARLSGQECIFVPTARITHKGGGSSGAKSAWTLRISARNRVLLYTRNTPLALVLLTWPFLLFGLFFTILQGACNRQVWAVLSGLVDGAIAFPSALEQRHRLSPPILPPLSLLRTLSWNPFAVLLRGHRVRRIDSNQNLPALPRGEASQPVQAQ